MRKGDLIPLTGAILPQQKWQIKRQSGLAGVSGRRGGQVRFLDLGNNSIRPTPRFKTWNNTPPGATLAARGILTDEHIGSSWSMIAPVPLSSSPLSSLDARPARPARACPHRVATPARRAVCRFNRSRHPVWGFTVSESLFIVVGIDAGKCHAEVLKGSESWNTGRNRAWIGGRRCCCIPPWTKVSANTTPFGSWKRFEGPGLVGLDRDL